MSKLKLYKVKTPCGDKVRRIESSKSKRAGDFITNTKMENNKKQNYSGAGSSKTFNQATDSNRQKSSFSDIQSNKHCARNSRRRENPTTSARNNNSTNNSKQHQLAAKVRPNVDKRPRGRGYSNYSQNASWSYRGANEDYSSTSTGLRSGDAKFCGSLDTEAGRLRNTDYELNSVYSPGSKKQNLNHLLNFYYTPREVDYYDGGGSSGYMQRHFNAKKHKYNKEQFLQANFQFVIKASANRKTDVSPDSLIDWSLIEQINIHTHCEPQCPICLYPPVAAKVTRCGHVYCWPCILQYLSLSDKTWRKCPICYDAVHVGDLKSTSIVQQEEFNVNSHITFRLMGRKKGSLYIEKCDGKLNDQMIEKYPYVSSPMEEKLFSKFILAKRNDVIDILTREQTELNADVDISCPEYVFIKQALELLKERREKLSECDQTDEEKYKLNENAQSATINDNNIKVFYNTENMPYKGVKKTKISHLTYDQQPYNFEGKVSESSPNIENTTSVTKLSTKFYYFYQSEDGQNIYLHPLNVKMLQACYGSLADAPSVIRARIIQKEQHSMDEDNRRKFTCLGHLPLTCEFSVVEIELQPPYVREDIIQAFWSDILFRKKERHRRAIEERKRENHINAINERQMGKIIASTANINITSSDEFPKCGFEESLVPSTDFDVTNNDFSTSQTSCSRTKTLSTSSTGSCSYSAIALHCKKEHAPWSTLNAAQTTKLSLEPANVERTSVHDGETSLLNTIHTNLGDVLAQALSQQKKEKPMKTKKTARSQSNTTGGNKKSKKSKKMQPLYSTGMNFGGN